MSLTPDLMLELAEKYNTPLFVYDGDLVLERYRDLFRFIPDDGLRIYYAMKANYNPQLLMLLRDAGCGIDAVSPGEVEMALQLGFAPERIMYTANNMTDAEFEALPYSSEGLWRKLMHAARSQATLEDILTATKSKRYTRTRLDRMVLCAFLGITKEILETPAPYVRVLAFNDKGREILNTARKTGDFRNIGESVDHPYQQMESRWGDLYGLFSKDPESPDAESEYRVYYHKQSAGE